MNLGAWLQYIESLHPREIDLGLDRVSAVARHLDLDLGSAKIISVAGTNGKGSCVAVLEGLLLAQGFRVGAYTSPHIFRFNERIRVCGNEVQDRVLCDTFSRIEAARDDNRLTYFEFATLAAFYIFQQAQLDVVVLEVGLGGRLDAVNIVDCDVAIITSIDLDHMAWLGESREAIGKEKAGIIRPGKPLICADRDPPSSVLVEARNKSAPVYLIGRDFDFQPGEDNSWDWVGKDEEHRSIILSKVTRPRLNGDSTAAAIQALSLLELLGDKTTVSASVGNIGLVGRFDQRYDSGRCRKVIFDVAHNPAAAKQLASRLIELRASQPERTKVALVLAMMGDKDVTGFAQALASAVDIWYIAQVKQDRCMAAPLLATELAESEFLPKPVVFDDAVEAYKAACSATGPEDTVVITGSFYTVAEILGFLKD